MTVTVVTGMPGSGKTAYVVDQLIDLVKSGRPLFVDGVPDLNLDHSPLPAVEQWTKLVDDPSSATGKKLVFDFPANSVIVLDECQRHFRVRPAGSKVPDAIAAFETHRHQGLDFFLITQHPLLLDSNIRRLARHIHLRNHPLGRQLYEWPEVNDPDLVSSRSKAAVVRYRLPKRAFSRYKSAEIHTKTKERLPFAVYVFGAAVLAVLGTAGWGYYRYKTSTVFNQDKLTGGDRLPGQSVPLGGSGGGAVQAGPVVNLANAESWVPAIPGKPESAPAYSQVRQIVAMPWPAACIKRADDCRCYTDQATRIREISPQRCEEILIYGAFNPYRQAQPAQPGTVQSGPVAQSVAGSGGAVGEGGPTLVAVSASPSRLSLSAAAQQKKN